MDQRNGWGAAVRLRRTKKKKTPPKGGGASQGRSMSVQHSHFERREWKSEPSGLPDPIKESPAGAGLSVQSAATRTFR